MRRRNGFTLVELLVVIGIIAVLISILLPALAAVRRHANSIKCMANLRSVGQALTLYTQDTSYYPAAFAVGGLNGRGVAVWPTKIRRYLRGSRGPFRCPERDERFEWSNQPVAAVAPAPVSFTGYGYELGEPLLDSELTLFSYGYNAIGLGTLTEVKSSQVRAAWDMIAVADSNGADGTGLDDLILQASLGTNCPPGTIHFGGPNVLFCDGHVQRYSRPEITLPADPNLSDPSQRRIVMMWNRNHSY